MKDALTTALIILWGQRDAQRSLRRLAPWEAVCWIIAGWNRERLEVWPNLARLVICRIALMPYDDPAVREFALAWVRREAQHWWMSFYDRQPESHHFKLIYERFVESGRI